MPELYDLWVTAEAGQMYALWCVASQLYALWFAAHRQCAVPQLLFALRIGCDHNGFWQRVPIGKSGQKG